MTEPEYIRSLQKRISDYLFRKNGVFSGIAAEVADWHREQGLIVRNQNDCTCPIHNTDSRGHRLAK